MGSGFYIRLTLGGEEVLERGSGQDSDESVGLSLCVLRGYLIVMTLMPAAVMLTRTVGRLPHHSPVFRTVRFCLDSARPAGT